MLCIVFRRPLATKEARESVCTHYPPLFSSNIYQGRYNFEIGLKLSEMFDTNTQIAEHIRFGDMIQTINKHIT